MHKGEGAYSKSTAGSIQHGSLGHVAIGGYMFGVGRKTCIVSGANGMSADGMLSMSMNSCMLMLGRKVWFVPVPASCTSSGALPMVVAAAGSCVRPECSSWHGIGGPSSGPEYGVPRGGTKAAGMLLR